MSETEKLLETWKHPDPYCPPTAPGGSKWERNLPAHTTARESFQWRIRMHAITNTILAPPDLKF